MPLTSLRRSPLVELAVSQLREQVLSGQWPVGGRLPAETELAQQQQSHQKLVELMHQQLPGGKILLSILMAFVLFELFVEIF